MTYRIDYCRGYLRNVSVLLTPPHWFEYAVHSTYAGAVAEITYSIRSGGPDWTRLQWVVVYRIVEVPD